MTGPWSALLTLTVAVGLGTTTALTCYVLHAARTSTMTPRALQVCPTPGCPTLTPSGRCDACQRKAGRQRTSATAKGYDTHWYRTRATYLRTHPYCECDECETLPPLLRPRATEVNHRDGLGPLGPRGHDWTNLQAMTKAHHSRHTAKEQPGGWNDRQE